MSIENRFFDLSALLPLRAHVTELDPSGPGAAQALAGTRPSQVRRLALLAGSFNPVTEAHLALAAAARRSGRVDATAYVIATRTVDKEKIEGASLADRLLCLEEIVSRRPAEGTLLVNRGLYVDQAQVIRTVFPKLDELWFVVGFDKIEQIFDPHYYADFAEALRHLFAHASFLVAPRGAAGAEALELLLRRPANRPYAAQVHRLDLEPQFRATSSSRVRSGVAAGASAAEVPAIVQRFIASTGAYQRPVTAPDGEEIDRYAWRERIIDLTAEGRLPMMSPAEFHAFWEQVTRLGIIGQRLRATLRAAGPGAAPEAQ